MKYKTPDAGYFIAAEGPKLALIYSHEGVRRPTSFGVLPMEAVPEEVRASDLRHALKEAGRLLNLFQERAEEKGSERADEDDKREAQTYLCWASDMKSQIKALNQLLEGKE